MWYIGNSICENNYTIKLSPPSCLEKLNWKAAELEREDQRLNVILNVTLAYLQVVNTQDLYRMAKNRMQSTEDQLRRLDAMFEEEMANPAEYRDFQGLRAADEANLITAKNNYEDALTAEQFIFFLKFN